MISSIAHRKSRAPSPAAAGPAALATSPRLTIPSPFKDDPRVRRIGSARPTTELPARGRGRPRPRATAEEEGTALPKETPAKPQILHALLSTTSGRPGAMLSWMPHGRSFRAEILR